MRFLLDENVELQVGRFLRALGHDVSAIALDYDRPVPDSEVLRIGS
jgi:hypothetical protein